MKNNKASMLGLLAMGAALSAIGESSPYGGKAIKGKSAAEWAKDKIAEQKARRNRKTQKKSKTKKHDFKVTYAKGVKPVFNNK